MVKLVKFLCAASLIALGCSGCGHSQLSKIGLISFGNLEGKTIPEKPEGPVLEGSNAGHNYCLSDAVRDALKETEYDTLVDAEVITETGLLVPSNKIIVRGTALNSSKLGQTGGAK